MTVVRMPTSTPVSQCCTPVSMLAMLETTSLKGACTWLADFHSLMKLVNWLARSPPPEPAPPWPLTLERKSTSTQPSSSIASQTSTMPVLSRLLTTALPW